MGVSFTDRVIICNYLERKLEIRKQPVEGLWEMLGNCVDFG